MNMKYSWHTFVRLAKVKHDGLYAYPKNLNTELDRYAYIKCPTHGVFKQGRRLHVVRGLGCPECGKLSSIKTRTKTTKDYKIQLNRSGINALPVVKYAGHQVKINHKCICGNTWAVTPAQLLNTKHPSGPCPKCKQLRGNWRKLTHEQARARIKEVHGVKIQMVGQYINMDTRHRFRCNICERTWKTAFTNVVNRKSGCPSCATQLPTRLSSSRSGFKRKTLSIDGIQFKVQGYEPQGIEWILRHSKLKAKDIKVDMSGEVPTIRYKIGKRNRTYFPDIFIPKLNRIVEIKSTYTLGLTTGRDWKKNQAKAKATIEAGYKFTLLVMNTHGFKIFKLPSDWYNMTRLEVLTYLAYHGADIVPKGVKRMIPIY